MQAEFPGNGPCMNVIRRMHDDRHLAHELSLYPSPRRAAGVAGPGIGSDLVRQMLERLHDLSMSDLMCDPELQPHHERFAFRRSRGMVIRNYDRQTGGDVS
jgi:hypothetical protein